MHKMHTENHGGSHPANSGFEQDSGRHAKALFSRAAQHQKENNADKAVEAYSKAIEALPTLTEAHYNIGVIRYGQGNWEAAITYFEQALKIKPDFVDAAFNLAAAYKESANFHQADLTYQKVIELEPANADAFFYQGICRLNNGQLGQAIRSLQQSVRLSPEHPLYWFHLAESYMRLKSTDDAIVCYTKTIELKPDWDSAHYNLAVALRMQERLEEAIYHLARSIEINPNFTPAHAFLFRLAQHTCDWSLAAESSRNLQRLTLSELSNGTPCAESPMTSIRRSADPRMNMDVAKSCSRRISQQVAAATPLTPFIHPRTSGRRIRIGYLSNDFKDHAVAHQIRGLLEKHDRRLFEIYGYAINPDNGTRYRQLLAGACDHFRDIHDIPDLAAARQIHEDGIHILVEMGGHSRDSRLGISAHRPAPVQVSYLGFLGSTGADFIDYAVADQMVVPPDHAACYTEKMVYLPHCYQVNDDQMPIAEHQYQRSDFNLPNKGFIYCCFNQPYKIDRPLFDTWLRILQQVDGSVLWLVKRSPLAQINLRRAAESAGVDPDRLIFTGFMPIEENLARLRLADLSLDTCIYNGGATTSNALWAGVPVLTVLGRHWVSRMSASALSAVGLPELITKDLKAYELKAIQLAHHKQEMDALRAKLTENRLTRPLFDTQSFTHHIEHAYQYMVQRYIQQLKPVSFMVNP